MDLDPIQASAVIPDEKGILKMDGRGFHFASVFARQHLDYILYENEYLCDAAYGVSREYVDCLMFLYVRQGEMELRYLDRTVRLKEGRMAFLDLHYPHYYQALGGELRTEQILLNGQGARAYFELLAEEQGFVFEAGADIVRQIEKIREELRSTSPDDHRIALCIHSILALLAAESRKPASPAVEEAKAYMAEHFREMLSLDEIAGAVALNKSYFSRLFRAETGYSPWEYMIRVRIREAFSLLSESSDSIDNIAEACGFAGASHFIRAFKKETGMTPHAFRKMFC